MFDIFNQTKIQNRLRQLDLSDIGGLPMSAQAFLVAEAFRRAPKNLLLIATNIKQQEELATNLEAWGVEYLFYPETIVDSEQAFSDPDMTAEKLAVLTKLEQSSEPILLLATGKGSLQPTPAPKEIRSAQFVLHKGQTISIETLQEKLSSYNREKLVSARGQWSRRGGILDVFSWHAELPVRLEWFGDEIESIRKFDLHRQTSVEEIDKTEIQLASLWDEVNSATLEHYTKNFQTIALKPETNIPSPLAGDFEEHTFLHRAHNDEILQENRLNLLRQNLLDWQTSGWQVWISSNNEGEQHRLAQWLGELDCDAEKFHFVISPLLRGFAWHSEKLILLTDAEIFGRYQTLRSLRKPRKSVEFHRPTLDPGELQLGDTVVHIEHGLALYCGIQDIPEQDASGDRGQALVLQFAEQAKLYVPIDQAYLVSKYIGTGRRHPPLDILGGNRWERAKAKARKAILDYSAQLLRTQAERQTLRKEPIPADTEWQKDFEDAFLYQETPDQLRAIAETKADMEQLQPMERLICGDVGFGKTEVAIRAGFKAVMGGKQVAFLVPTTVLAQQHWNTFRERMADYPVRVEMVSRFLTKKQQNQILRETAEGNVDILIGTHRLISGDVKFKNLGLVIVDEEQRFGVKQKEQLKNQFRLVDILTLSATPIPRTLYLALTGARDMSTIETPPPNRHPVETTVAGYDERLIRSAVQRELNRGGQVYFLHNRVRTIEHTAQRLQHLMPDARIDIGHGQMDEDELEEIMNRFIQGKTDILLATTIIENGLDIPNANTIIIDRADRFGLADLYQLRGRVGRSENRAYALLLLPRDLVSGDAGKRVRAIRQYTELGSGYKIAMRDLEIRGAGNLLGTAQSGHIAAIGFDLYCRLLRQTIARLKNETPTEARSISISIDFLKQNPDLLQIPPAYISETEWRVAAYRDLAKLQNLEQWNTLGTQWRDRFGAWPEPVEVLLRYHRVRISALSANLDRVEAKENKLMLQRGGDYIMLGHKFPRLTESNPKAKLQQIEQWIQNLISSSSK